MRFQRSDLPGLAIAALAPPALFILFLASFDVWDHHGTPLLGAMSANIAIGAGIAAAFSRYIRSWDAPLALLGLLLASVAGVIWAQQSGNDGTALATMLKWVGVLAFLLLNVAVLWQILNNAILPMLDRRDARRKAEQAAAAE